MAAKTCTEFYRDFRVKYGTEPSIPEVWKAATDAAVEKLSAIKREFEKPLKSVELAAQSGEAPVQQTKAAIILLDKLQAWDDGDLPGSINMVDAVISEWRKIKAAVR